MMDLQRKFRNPQKIFSVGTSHYFFIGMGKIEISVFQLLKAATARSLTVRIKDSYPALALGKTGRAECHLTRGYLVGAVEVMTRRHWACEETRCLCEDDPYCEFKLTPVAEESGRRAWRERSASA